MRIVRIEEPTTTDKIIALRPEILFQLSFDFRSQSNRKKLAKKTGEKKRIGTIIRAAISPNDSNIPTNNEQAIIINETKASNINSAEIVLTNQFPQKKLAK